ncbi:MAG: type II toxin-antitoxin system PemK/MazF family toxin [Burkholderiaceae bacterium]|nr:type II toxin-antitoxin system PemK/MazF family toxin [Burkholderiaceae bacterium]
MKRGDIVAVAMSGDYGKPRPAVVIQSDLFDQHPSVTVLPITSDRSDAPIFRIDLSPDPSNGLRLPSQVMVDRIQTVPRRKIGAILGTVSEGVMNTVERALAVFLGIA